MLALEDMCSVLDLPTRAKHDGTMERVARAVRPLSTAPEEDVALILKRVLFAWFIADGDMHLRNIALLKIASPDEDKSELLARNRGHFWTSGFPPIHLAFAA